MNKIMENNETQEITPEESVDTSVNDGQTSEGDTTDWKAEALKHKAIAERKDKKLQEILSTANNDVEEKKEDTINKTNQESSGLSREEAIFFAKGGSEEDLTLAKKIAAINGCGILAAMEDDYYKGSIEKKQAETARKNAQLGASGGSPTGSSKKQKAPGGMTREEHMKYTMERLNG
jgi:hypothetical protein